MEMARLAATRSTCLRRKVGAVFVRDRNLLASGYNGAPAGVAHCAETGCLRERAGIPSGERHEICRGLHAEQNGIIQAARHGLSITGATLYCTNSPCIICAKMLINVGVARIVCADGYPDELARQMLEEAGMRVELLPEETR
jgi:dCMP deaminase